MIACCCMGFHMVQCGTVLWGWDGGGWWGGSISWTVGCSGRCVDLVQTANERKTISKMKKKKERYLSICHCAYVVSPHLMDGWILSLGEWGCGQGPVDEQCASQMNREWHGCQQQKKEQTIEGWVCSCEMKPRNALDDEPNSEFIKSKKKMCTEFCRINTWNVGEYLQVKSLSI